MKIRKIFYWMFRPVEWFAQHTIGRLIEFWDDMMFWLGME